MKWTLTLSKGLVVGLLMAIVVWQADIQAVPEQWAVLLGIALECVRDLLKAAFGQFVPSNGSK